MHAPTCSLFRFLVQSKGGGNWHLLLFLLACITFVIKIIIVLRQMNSVQSLCNL